MSFMDRLNETAKRKQTQTPKVGVAQNAVTNHSFTNGKSRVQGGAGVGQAGQGWKSQYASAGDSYKKQINPIINSLSNSNVSYETPKITKSLLTNEGFNQALGVVGAKNNAKLKMQNQKVKQGMLGSLLNAESQNNALSNRFAISKMNNATDRRGQDFTKESKANTLAQAGVRDANTKEYYNGLISQGNERNRIANQTMLDRKTPKPTNPLDDRIKRQKLVEKNGIKGLVNAEQFGTLSSEQQADIKGRFIMTGELPQLSGGDDGALWDTSAKVSYEQQNEPTAQPQQEAFKLDTNQTNTVLADFAKDTGQALSDLVVKDNVIVSKKGKFSLQDAWETMNGN